MRAILPSTPAAPRRAGRIRLRDDLAARGVTPDDPTRSALRPPLGVSSSSVPLRSRDSARRCCALLPPGSAHRRRAPGCGVARAWSAGAARRAARRPGRDRFAERRGVVDATCVGSAVVRDEVDRPGTGPVAFGLACRRRRLRRPGGVWSCPRSSSACAAGVVADDRRRRAGPCAAARRPTLAGSRCRRAASTSPSPTARSPPPSGQAPCRRGGRADHAAASSTRSCWPATSSCTAGAPVDVRWLLRRLAERYRNDAGSSPSTACVGATPELLVRRERGWSPRGCWPARSGAPATTTHDLALAASLARSSEGPRGARVRRALGRRRARPALLVDERARGAVRAAPAQRHAPGHRRRRGRSPTTPVVADPGRGAAPVGGGRRHPDRGGRCALIGELEGMDRGRYAGPVGWMDATGDGEWGIALRCGAVDVATRRDPAVRRLRHRRRLRPRGRAGRVRRQVRADARRVERSIASLFYGVAAGGR